MNENKIIDKLIKIAENQQKIIKRLAQQIDPTTDYIKRAAETAALNSGLSGVQISVRGDRAVNQLSGGASNAGEESYTVYVQNAPEDNAAKQQFIDTLNRQIIAQKPDLDGKINVIFA